MEEFDPQASFEKDLEQYGQIPATHSEVQGFVAACLTCLHVMPGYSFCEAFPEGDGIPAEIQMGFDKHLEPRESDHGVQYEFWAGHGMPKPKWAPE